MTNVEQARGLFLYETDLCVRRLDQVLDEYAIYFRQFPELQSEVARVRGQLAAYVRDFLVPGVENDVANFRPGGRLCGGIIPGRYGSLDPVQSLEDVYLCSAASFRTRCAETLKAVFQSLRRAIVQLLSRYSRLLRLGCRLVSIGPDCERIRTLQRLMTRVERRLETR